MLDKITNQLLTPCCSNILMYLLLYIIEGEFLKVDIFKETLASFEFVSDTL